jgi:hypothetical protein
MMGHPITVSVDVDIDLSDIDTEDLIDELKSRDADDSVLSMDEQNTLTKIWIHDREGRKEQAYALMRKYVLDRLGKVV